MNCYEIGNENFVINRKLNIAFIGMPDSVERRTTISKDPGSSSWEGKQSSTYLVFGHCVGERLLWRWCTGKSFKFLTKVTRDVFFGLNSKLFYEKLNNIFVWFICVLSQLVAKASKAIPNGYSNIQKRFAICELRSLISHTVQIREGVARL